MTVVLVLLVLALLRFALVAIGVGLLIRPVRACPACFRETVAVRRRWLAASGFPLEWRWCPQCSWEGPARRVHPRGPGDCEPRSG